MLIRDRLPAYISWDRFEANQARLTANRNRPATPGAPRSGPAMLAGLVRCGRCGRRMVVRYSGPNGRLSYTCTRGSADYAEPLCQGLSNGAALDDLATGQLLAAVAPAALEASLAAVAKVERQRAELTRQWELRRERAAYDVDRACRQFQACEPENRLVARELEHRWEDALKAQRQVDDEYARFARSAPSALSDTAVSSIRAGGRPAGRLVGVDHDPGRPPADRPAAARAGGRHRGQGERAGGRTVALGRRCRGLAYPDAPVRRYDQHSDYPRLVERLRELCGLRRTAAEIARRLTAEGFRPPKRTARFTRSIVLRLIGQLGLGCRPPHGSPAGLGPDEYRPAGLAQRLGINRDTVRRWVRVGWVQVRRDDDGHHVIWADASELRRLEELHRAPADLGQQIPVGEPDEAEATAGAVDSTRPDRRSTGHPTAIFGGIMAGTCRKR